MVGGSVPLILLPFLLAPELPTWGEKGLAILRPLLCAGWTLPRKVSVKSICRFRTAGSGSHLSLPGHPARWSQDQDENPDRGVCAVFRVASSTERGRVEASSPPQTLWPRLPSSHLLFVNSQHPPCFRSWDWPPSHHFLAEGMLFLAQQVSGPNYPNG